MKDLPKEFFCGNFNTSHVQGIAMDRARGFMYFSFTTCLIKTDLQGNILGSCVGLTGHLGCLAMNYEDGRVYGTLEYKEKKCFYLAIFDVRLIDRTDMHAERDGILKTVYLKEVVDDYTADMDGNGVFDGDVGDTLDHRYGCSGIDGITFGKIPGSADSKKYLMIAYGIYSNINRADNDYQVILRYGADELKKYECVLSQDKPHTSGPDSPLSKYFVYTGNTNYGVQNLEYDEQTGDYFMFVYTGHKPQFPNYSMYVIDGAVPPKRERLIGQAIEQCGETLSLKKIGLKHEESGVYGFHNAHGSTGIISLGGGLYYIAIEGGIVQGEKYLNNATVKLFKWLGDGMRPMIEL